MVSRIVLAFALFILSSASFVVFVDFAHVAIRTRNSDDRLFASVISIAALGVTLALVAGGMWAAGL